MKKNIISGSEFLKTLQDLPSTWVGRSGAFPSTIAKNIDRSLTRFGIKTLLKDEPRDIFDTLYIFDEKLSINFEGARIIFSEKTYGCEIEVTIKDKKEVKQLYFFWGIWKLLIENGSIWGGPYKKNMSTEHKTEGDNAKAPVESMTENKKNYEERSEPQSLKLPWEHMEGATEDEKRLVIIWCTQTSEGKELADKSMYTAPGNTLKRLRDKYEKAGIPKGRTERKKFRENYLQAFKPIKK